MFYSLIFQISLIIQNVTLYWDGTEEVGQYSPFHIWPKLDIIVGFAGFGLYRLFPPVYLR